MTRLLEHREQLREERRERPRTAAPRTAPAATAPAGRAARPGTAGFRDCRGVWHPWDEVA
ncbi:MAG: hypothetical protein KJ938_08940 [Actinobacteria bacterium]|nr:hypothetical protein [Actinomycetota bacterium]